MAPEDALWSAVSGLAHALLDLDQIVLSWSAPLMVDHRTGKLVAAFAAAAGLAFGELAHAQTSNAGAIATVRANNQSVVPAYATAHDAKGQAVSTDGAVEAGEDRSGFPNAGTDDAFDTLSGVGSTSGATIFSGGLDVVTAPAASAKVNDNQTNTSGGGATASPSGGVSNVDQSIQHR
ncbi:MAG TPA: hypothetical protein VGF50_04615 [Caulobacteraceae bacterium]